MAPTAANTSGLPAASTAVCAAFSWPAATTYHVVEDSIEGKMWTTKLHRSFMANGERADPSLRHVDGSTDPAVYRATIGTQQNVIRIYRDFTPSVPAIDSVDCSGAIDLADTLFLIQGLTRDRTSSPTCPMLGDRFASRQCDSNGDHARNRDDIDSLLQMLVGSK